MRKSNKWARGLGKKLVGMILELEPVSVDFCIEHPKFILCTITTESGNISLGLSICSVLDEFSIRKGRNKAAGRALKALVTKTSSEDVRFDYDQFPDTWTKRQMKRVMTAYKDSYAFKSIFVE